MVQLNKQLGLSHGKIATLLRDRFGVTVTSSTVTRALHRAARQARPTYVALCETIRGSPVVAPNETSWRVNGRGHWLWAFATPETTVYAIQPGRGFTQAAALVHNSRSRSIIALHPRDPRSCMTSFKRTQRKYVQRPTVSEIGRSTRRVSALAGV